MACKSKDVIVPGNEPPHGGQKKSAESLPKILEIAVSTGSLQPQRVRCGKAGCKCARGESHDGLYYFFWSTPAGVRKRYVRRADVDTVRVAIERRNRRDASFNSELRQAESLLRRLLASVRVKA